MSQLMQFMYEETTRVRSLIDDRQETLWCALDVCRILGLSNVTHSCARLDDDEKRVFSFSDVTGRQQSMVFVTESGLYSLMMRSYKPEAKAFKRWITHEVLPQIRRTGTYSGSRDHVTALYVAARPRPHQKYFDREFYHHLYRLHDKMGEFPDDTCYPIWTAAVIDQLIYRRSFPADVMRTIRAHNPRLPSGGRRRRHGQHLTVDVGERQLIVAIGLCLHLMRQAHDMAHLLYMLDLIAPVRQRELPFREVFQGRLTAGGNG